MSAPASRQGDSAGRSSTVSVTQALADYSQRIQVNTLEKYPMIWSGHYAAAPLRCLGQFTVAEMPEGRSPVAAVALGMLSPFGMSLEVGSAFLVVDVLRVPVSDQAFESSRVLYVSRLAVSNGGVLASHWTVGLNDLGFAKAEQTSWYLPDIWQAVSVVMNQRLDGKADLSWDDAMHAALDVAREALG